ncbi:mannose-1-phosphate guanylyltransferase [Cecembia lonarensis]|uniref:Alginate biosynthesis protein AlgA n=1 Tax=Cecembia lonarensis (strain CCUG 58316 / KCTC 22772 / LW9) TaxID=1225176 RepID=K1LFR1_CECL9|nr:mannose-1-phosphate guanylyltransferase [Cecembia lonarensis]EKB49133.1 Alginate biosynthesis protein AlgA [Cecembia lonarensis LW9]
MIGKKIHVLLSGGSGSRLWPLSRKSQTKQYIPIFEGMSLFEKAIRLNAELCQQGVVVLNKSSLKVTQEVLSKGSFDNYRCIVESKPKNTAAAIAFAAFQADLEDLLLVTPSDHVIENREAYVSAVEEAFDWASKGYLVTFGIQPHKPETGYGYIQSEGSDVIAFHEKPSPDKAKQFLSEGNYYWNSGIFAFKAGVYLEELKQYRPDIFLACQKVIRNSHQEELHEKLSEAIPSESIDYAVMERSDRIKVVRSQFKWSDLGSFESLFEYFREKSAFVSGSNLIITDDQVELHGLENVMVIQHQGALMVMPLSMSQEVKKIYERLAKEGSALVE